MFACGVYGVSLWLARCWYDVGVRLVISTTLDCDVGMMSVGGWYAATATARPAAAAAEAAAAKGAAVAAAAATAGTGTVVASAAAADCVRD